MSNIGNKEVLSRNLKYYIDLSGKDRKELAKIWGFPYSTVTDWINARKYPRIDRIEIMADYFGILKSDLIEDKTVQEQIEENPVKMADAVINDILSPTASLETLHLEALDKDFVDLFEDFKKLDADQKKIVKEVVASFAGKK